MNSKTITQMKELKADGNSLRAIGAAVGVSYETARYWLNDEYRELKRLECKERNNSVESRDQYLQRNYSISYDEYLGLWDKQNGKCAICGVQFDKKFDFNIHVDHSHKTGLVRGILCARCNHGIGHFKDDVSICTNAAKYLQSSKWRDQEFLVQECFDVIREEKRKEMNYN